MLRLLKFSKLQRCYCQPSDLSRCISVLGIETSCDDTGAAVVDSNKNILGEAKISQSKIHSLHGGILPEFAKDLHKQNIKNVVDEALEKSQLNVKDLDAIAVTVKPGLMPCLLIGCEYAKDLCVLYKKDLIPIHHMEAHALTIRLMENVEFPFLVLLMSGGHCILAVAEGIEKYSVLGETLDTTPGVLFDKLSRRMKLRNLEGFTFMQGGVAIETSALSGDSLAITFPHSQRRNCNFSFSGLLNSVKTYIESEESRLGIQGDQLLPNVHDVCASFQFHLTKFVCNRVETAINYLHFKNINTNVLVLSGGVASNNFIRTMLGHVCDHYNYKLLAPPKRLCTDNGVMVAWNGIEKLKQNIPCVQTKDLQSVRCHPKCALGESLAEDVTLNASKQKYIDLRTFLKSDSNQKSKMESAQAQDVS